jgi:shikimate dehydrogenase
MKKAGVRSTYLTFSASEGELESVVSKLRNSRIEGFNITIPFKERIIKHLDTISTEAEQIGAVNTVKKEGNTLVGFNTDCIGFVRTLEDNNFEPAGRRALILGSGGAARAVCFGLLSSTALSLVIASRNTDSAQAITDNINCRESGISCKAISISDSSIIDETEQADLIVNTTPVGSSRCIGSSPLPEGAPLHNGQVVFDIVYEPPVTPLLAQAALNGAGTVNGLGMLVHQALESLKIWTGVEVDAGYVLNRL